MEQLHASGGLARVGRKYRALDAAALLGLVQPEAVPELIGMLDPVPWAERGP
jgi:hypothetical protein